MSLADALYDIEYVSKDWSDSQVSRTHFLFENGFILSVNSCKAGVIPSFATAYGELTDGTYEVAYLNRVGSVRVLGEYQSLEEVRDCALHVSSLR